MADQIQRRHRPQPSKAAYGSDIVAELLKGFGIEYLALNPGATFRGLHDSVVNFGGNVMPEVILCTHEEITVGIANGYARAKGRPMAAAVHDIVGLQHAATAIYNAWCDRAPVLVLGGTGPMDTSQRRPWIDWVHTALVQGNQVRDYVKWDDQPAGLRAIPASFARAYRLATTDPPGPVYLCYDAALQEAPVTEPVLLADLQTHPAAVPPQAPAAVLDQLAAWLVEAEHPVAIADMMGRNPRAVPLLVRLAELLGIPVIDRGGRLNFPNTHPLDAAGIADDLLSRADLVLALDVQDLYGALCPSRTRKDVRAVQPIVPEEARLVHVTLEPYVVRSWANDFNELQPVDLPILASSAEVLKALIPLVQDRLARNTARQARCRERSEAVRAARDRVRRQWAEEAARQADQRPISSWRFYRELWEAIRHEDWVHVSGTSRWGERRVWEYAEAGRYLGGSRGGGLGYGISQAVGGALALKGSGKLCVNVQSDGDLLYAPGALWTLTHHRIPLLIVMYNNRSYYNDEEHQEEMAKQRGRPVENKGIGIHLRDPNPNFAGLARDLGLWAEGPIEDPAAMGPALQRALRVVKEGGTALVDVVVQAGSRA
ncbi:MAG: thiamine pyrophosphate-binding protein [Deltaproteobacteria bacterium]|nr:thiamine pyrophosphate-binding protein [Deltaproteobacteria bacterium]